METQNEQFQWIDRLKIQLTSYCNISLQAQSAIILIISSYALKLEHIHWIDRFENKYHHIACMIFLQEGQLPVIRVITAVTFSSKYLFIRKSPDCNSKESKNLQLQLKFMYSDNQK
jgi:hypothetical protein